MQVTENRLRFHCNGFRAKKKKKKRIVVILLLLIVKEGRV